MDIDSNNISLFNLIEKLTFPISVEQLKEAHDQGKQGIFFPIEFEVVTRYRRANETQSDAMDARLRLINPEGKVILSHDEKIALKKGISNLRLRNKFNGFPVDKAGTYWLAVEVKSVDDSSYTEVYRTPIDVVLKAVDSKNA